MTSLGEAVAQAAARLAAAGVGAPRREARLIVALAAGLEQQTVLGWPERALPPQAGRSLDELVGRRCSGEPLSRLRGQREFWSMMFRLGPDTLDPRPDTETLIEATLARLPDRNRPFRVLDLGTGSGCILLALLRELPSARGVGLDLAPGACAVARVNAEAMGLASRAAFVASDWARCLRGGFDIVVSNPPYVPDGDISNLDPAVARFDPLRALAGGPDGLSAYRIIVADLPRLLGRGGLAAFEVGAGQAGAVAALLAGAGMGAISTRRDLAGIERCVLAAAAENGG
ncbi:MAG: peptide chain release factor N(5)-glutamine methyltransferase [Alphaproteobacteria bacterium]